MPGNGEDGRDPDQAACREGPEVDINGIFNSGHFLCPRGRVTGILAPLTSRRALEEAVRRRLTCLSRMSNSSFNGRPRSAGQIVLLLQIFLAVDVTSRVAFFENVET